jgi:hypothetical protein
MSGREEKETTHPALKTLQSFYECLCLILSYPVTAFFFSESGVPLDHGLIIPLPDSLTIVDGTLEEKKNYLREQLGGHFSGLLNSKKLLASNTMEDLHTNLSELLINLQSLHNEIETLLYYMQLSLMGQVGEKRETIIEEVSELANNIIQREHGY